VLSLEGLNPPKSFPLWRRDWESCAHSVPMVSTSYENEKKLWCATAALHFCFTWHTSPWAT